MRFVDKCLSLFYKLVHSNAYNEYNCCNKCRVNKRNWLDVIVFKPNQLIGYDRVLDEYVLFNDSNLYAKSWIMAGYIVEVGELSEKMWTDVRYMCKWCIERYIERTK